MPPPDEPIVVEVDPDLKEFIPEFLSNRQADIDTLRSALDRSDWETIRQLGHRMRGSGGGYGFDAITTLGTTLESAAKAQDKDTVKTSIDELAEYLARVVIR